MNKINRGNYGKIVGYFSLKKYLEYAKQAYTNLKDADIVSMAVDGWQGMSNRATVYEKEKMPVVNRRTGNILDLLCHSNWTERRKKNVPFYTIEDGKVVFTEVKE